MGKLSGKTAVITGSTRGLGLAIAQAYASEGAAVVVSSRTAAAVDKSVAMRHFLARNSGKLINLVGTGAKKPMPMQNAYGSSKAWVRNFTLALAKGYKQTNVGVFVFQPGLVDTDMTRQIDVVSGYEQRIKVFPTIIRMWSNPPEAPADKATWLASAATDGKTGLEISTNGLGFYIAGALREGWRRVSRQPGETIELQITSING